MILTRWFVEHLMDMPAKPAAVLRSAEKAGFSEEAVRELAKEYGFRESDDSWRFTKRKGRLIVVRKIGVEKIESAQYTRTSGWEIRRWLRSILGGKGRWSNEVYETGKRRGYHPKMIQRAKNTLSVETGPPVKLESGGGTRRRWRLVDRVKIS